MKKKSILKIFVEMLLIILVGFLGILFYEYFLEQRSPNMCPICGEKHIIHSFVETIGLPKGEKITYDLLCKKYGEPTDFVYSCEQQEENKYKSILEIKYEKLSFKFCTYEKDVTASPFDNKWELLSITTYDPAHVFEHGIHVGCTKWRILWQFRKALPVKEAAYGTEYWDHSELEIVHFSYDNSNNVKSIEYFPF